MIAFTVLGDPMSNGLTAERLRDVLAYDHSSGVFTWKKRPPRHGGAKVGDVAGGVGTHGYIRLSVDGRSYRAHRLVWLYVYGEWPSGEIDHFNGIKDDNRVVNLRMATRSENLQNQGPLRPSNKSSGILGVSRKRDKWQAYIKVAGRRTIIGTFTSVEEAAAAYQRVKRELHPFAVPR